ncbi:MAG: SAVED domain-containing protein, partial [Pirellulaceae bacterium]
ESLVTDPTGRSFLSYRRVRSDEAALLIGAQHDHGIPTWQDVEDLGTVPTEDELRRVLSDPSTSSAVLFLTPEVKYSPIIRNVEIPKIVQRTESGTGFFAVPLAAGGLDYSQAAKVASNHVSAQDLADWNMHRIREPKITGQHAAVVANHVLIQRIQAVHKHIPFGDPLRVGFFIRRAPGFETGNSLVLNWSRHFKAKEATQQIWRDTLLPALSRVADAIRQHAPGREVEAFGIPTLPAAVALGCEFLSTSGLRMSWRQVTPGRPDQVWSLSAAREDTGFKYRLVSGDPNARDIAVLVSVADNVEPVFATYRRYAPRFRAIVHVARCGPLPFLIHSAGQATDIALTFQDAIRTARCEYGNVGTVHLFVAVPAGLAVLFGQLLNTFGSVQTYEHVSTDGSGCYRQASLLSPCM